MGGELLLDAGVTLDIVVGEAAMGGFIGNGYTGAEAAAMGFSPVSVPRELGVAASRAARQVMEARGFAFPGGGSSFSGRDATSGSWRGYGWRGVGVVGG